MTIDIRGVNTHNKGAHLMLVAAVEALGAENLTLSPNGSEFDVRSRIGLRQTLILNQAPRATARAGSVVPESVKAMYGLVAARDLTGVLDASGFAYSDSFGPARAKREAKLARLLTRRGVARVFLPQAFGPFEHKETARWSRELLNGAGMIYARDRQSLDHLSNLSPDAPVALAPDFTVQLAGSQWTPVIEGGGYLALVPNSKILTHSEVTHDQYTSALGNVATLAKRAGLRVLTVVHEFNDRGIARTLQEVNGVEVVEHRDPLVLKRVLADAEFVVASRFHALVSSLSSGTPALALGWSHKYRELMTDFGVPELFVPDISDLGSRAGDLVEGRLDHANLAARVSALKQESESMWAQVRSSMKL